MTTVVDQVITIFDAVWKGDAATKSAFKSLQQYQAVGGKTAVAHMALAQSAQSTKNSMMALGATYGDTAIKQEAAVKEFDRLDKILVQTEADMEKLIPTTQSAGDKFKEFAKTGMAIGVALVGVTMALKTAYTAMKKLYDAAGEGAGMIQLRDSFNYLNASVMKTPGLLNDMVSASNNTISQMAAMEGVMTLVAGMSEQMTQSFADSAPRLMEIAKAANKLNPTLGDTAFMFNSIARGIKRQEPRLLDNLGLNVKVAMASQVYADKMGIAITAMTAEDKQQALLNETLRVGKLLIDQVGGSTESAADGYLGLAAATEDYTNAYKESLGRAKFGQKSVQEVIELKTLQINTQNALAKAEEAGLITTDASVRMFRAAINGQRDYLEIITMVEAMLGGVTTAQIRYATAAQDYLTFQRAWAGDFAAGEILEGDDDADWHTRIWRWEKLSSAWLSSKEAADDLVVGLDGLITTQDNLDARFASRLETAKNIVKETEDLIKVIRDADSATGDYAVAQMDAERGTGLFNEAISDIGVSWGRVDGKTKEEREEIERLEGKLSSATTRLGDMEMGLGQFGRKEDAIAKSTGKLASDISILNAAIAALAGEEGELIKINTKATWNQENINKSVLDAADAHGASSEEMVAYKIAIGELSEEQGVAVLRAAAMAEATIEAGRMIDEGFAPTAVIEFVDRMETYIDNMNMWVRTSPWIDKYIDPTTGDSVFTDTDEAGREFLVDIQYEKDPDTLIEQYKTIQAGAQGVIDVDGEVAKGIVDNILAGLEAITAEPWVAEILIKKVAKVGEGGGNGGVFIPGAKAFGGPVQQNVPYWVGERGPELVVPKSNSDVMSTYDLEEGGSRGDVHMALNIYGNITSDELQMAQDNAFEKAYAQVGA